MSREVVAQGSQSTAQAAVGLPPPVRTCLKVEPQREERYMAKPCVA